MLTLVISAPQPAPPEAVAGQRLAWRTWIERLEAAGEVRDWHFRAGRGAVVVFDLPDNETLHLRLTEWLGFIPAQFDLYPLVDRAAHDAMLRRLRDGLPPSAS